MDRKKFLLSAAVILIAPQRLITAKVPAKTKPRLTPKEEWGKWATDAQKEFARRCIRYGQQQAPQRGHTLAGIAWMESSLNFYKEHNEDSHGPFGMSLGTAKLVRRLRNDPAAGDDKPWSDEALRTLLKNDFNYAADMTLWLFEHHRRWFLSEGYSLFESWKFAAQKYAGYHRWRTRKTYGNIFNDRVKFLKTIEA